MMEDIQIADVRPGDVIGAGDGCIVLAKQARGGRSGKWRLTLGTPSSAPVERDFLPSQTFLYQGRACVRCGAPLSRGATASCRGCYETPGSPPTRAQQSPAEARAKQQAAAERLKAARARAGLSQRELAEKAGIATGYVGVMETARQRITEGCGPRLAAALGVTWEWLRDGSTAASEPAGTEAGGG
jgi:hypothetical protein